LIQSQSCIRSEHVHLYPSATSAIPSCNLCIMCYWIDGDSV
jgi:hypothetical protein